MRLEEIANIKQGIPLNRIRTSKHTGNEKRMVYSFETESQVLVPKNIEDIEQKIPIIKEDMILLNITSYNAKRAEKEDLGKIVSSNYVIIEVKNKKKVNPDYLGWYIDQSESFKRELHRIKQGSTIMSIPINEFRKVNIRLPDIDFQEKLGNIYKLSNQREKLFRERKNLLEKYLLVINEEEILNGKG